jgi:predicted RNA-binding protein Jag
LPGTDVPPAQVPESEPEEGEAEAPEAAEQGWGEPEEDGRARYADETEVDEGDRAEVEDLGPEPSAPEVLALVRGILADAGLVVSVDLTEERDRLVLNLSGADRDLLLERRGEGLDALQYLATRVARKTLGTRKRIRLESDGFRLRREDELRTMARDAAERAHRRGEAVWLPALNPYERRIVHLEVASLGGVTSKSDGDGFVKRVSVRSTATAPRGARGGRGRRPR